MQNQLTQQLGEAYERLRLAKHERKCRREELKRECESQPGYAGFTEDKKHAAENLKRIKLEVAEQTGLKADIDEKDEAVKLEQDIIAGIIGTLIGDGSLKLGEEYDIGDMIIAPTIKVNLNAQLKLNL